MKDFKKLAKDFILREGWIYIDSDVTALYDPNLLEVDLICVISEYVNKSLARQLEITAYIELIKAELINSSEDVNKEEMIEWTSAIAEFKELRVLKFDRYPLLVVQLTEWIEQGKLPNIL